MIVIDSREPADLKNEVRLLCETAKIEHKSSQLIRGDFALRLPDKTIIIERKSVNDFMSSLLDDRAPRQFSNMLDDEKEIPVLGFDGFPMVGKDGFIYRNNKKSGWRWVTLLGMLTTLQSAGLIVHWVPPERYGEFVIQQYKYWSKPSHGTALTQKNRKNRISRSKLVLMAFPGISSDLADRILAKHPLWIVLNDPKVLEDIPGVGQNTILEMRKILYDNSVRREETELGGSGGGSERGDVSSSEPSWG